MVSSRRQTNLRLSEAARRGFDRITRPRNLYLVSLVEAVGLALDDRSFDLPPEIVARAEQIQYERNNPGRKP